MINGLDVAGSVNFLLVFVEGLLSFFSPCVIPLIPVYMSYLSGGSAQRTEDGLIVYDRKKVFFNTLFFVFGISFAFFILGMSFTALGQFFNKNKILFTRIGGIIIIVLGLYQLGIFNFSFLKKERKINLNLGDRKITPLIALVMGFTFSFAWTPCVGPTLSSVLILASSASSKFEGNMLVIVYALGFLIPFLALGLFTGKALNFLKKHQKLLKYTVKIGGVILIIIGVMMLTGWMNRMSGYLSSISDDGSQAFVENTEGSTDSEENGATVNPTETPEASSKLAAYDFTLTDQYGNNHTLSDYKGKVVFINFWATWCPPCKEELPDIEALYREYNFNEDEVVLLGVVNPSTDEFPQNSDVSIEEINKFMDDNGYTFPTLFDESSNVLRKYGISAFPTTFIVDKYGDFVGYVPGMMTKDIMINVINQALDVEK